MKSENRAKPPTRRDFFRNLLGETVSLLHETRGTPQLRLSDLQSAPDETLRGIVPVIKIRPHFRLEPQRLLMQNRATGVFEEICRFDAVQKFILGYVDGQRSLENIAALVQNRFELEAHAAFGCVKGFFLALVKAAVCQPARTQG
jgi:hypothetical protein